MSEDCCETCGDLATQWDYDQLKYLCDRHVEQADFTVPLDCLPKAKPPKPDPDYEPCVCGHSRIHHKPKCSGTCRCAAFVSRAIAEAQDGADIARHPNIDKVRCPACKRLTRITTAGCDHCDLEDK